MAFEFKLPDLGEGIAEAQIISVSIKEGDTVEEDQPIMEVETDKAAVEIPVPKGGKVSKLHVKAGDTVKVGQVLVEIGGEGGGAPAAPAAVEKPVAQAAEKPAQAAPPAQRPAAQKASTNGDGDGHVATQTATPRITIPDAGGAAALHRGPVPATPAVRRMAREYGIDIRTVPGSGPGGRILQEDLEKHRQSGGASSAAAESPAAGGAESAPPFLPAGIPGEALPDFSQWGEVTREGVPQIRKAIARQMTRSWLTVPRVTHGDDVDLTELEEFRKQHSEKIVAAGGIKPTITAFMLKALAATLKQHPKLNCSFDHDRMEVIWKHYVHVGIAVDSPRGLVVPCLRDVDKKSLATISTELADLSARVRESKFDIAELRGGSFTLSNVGALGGTFSTPMVNYPETAILVTGRLDKKPVVRDDRVVVRKIMPLALSFDHRIIDGADAARFMKTLIGLLEDPVGLLMTA
jgi:pyruvate dehydrogenase complex dihydrolipoamide acetyltransferase long form